MIHDVWTTKGNRYAFIGATANYIDDDWISQSTHLTLKMVAWRHFGALLARPIGRFLTRHDLHEKISSSVHLFYFVIFSFSSYSFAYISNHGFFTYMLAQTTDSGGNNGPMAKELEGMFAGANNPVHWDSSANHIRCYAHKLNLTVGHGLSLLGQKVSKAKPSTPHGIPLPIPTLEVNGGQDDIEIDETESDEENGDGLPATPDGVDDEEGSIDYNTEVFVDKGDLVGLALVKVSALYFFSCSFLSL